MTTHCIPSSVLWLNRFALSIIFCWFGILKILAVSPAETLIIHLHQLTLDHLLPVRSFLILLGLIECGIGILWLIPAATRFVIIVFTLQMATTFLPLILLPADTWHHLLILSLPGQYILKNIVLIASAFTIYKDCQTNGWQPLRPLASFFRARRH